MSALDPASHHSVEFLYRDHHGWLQGWLRGKLGSAFDAADLAHDTFVRILVDRNAQLIREPRSYLATIAGRVVVDHYRRQALERAYLEALAHWPQPLALSCEERAILLEALYEIDAMLDGLGSRLKQVFILSQLEGLTYAQIAERLNMGLRTVNKYMAQAVAHICLMQP
ncbi:sigma-70 family RNA polymerase sigma factor [Variovorax sp. Sphag1AA]|uniref:sigma-70 family RNA polymerase sigma factor n=1 Tax=Variovorax sp. Sphag1AA TaxID=2587027 RepID=UPI00162253B4|nr:sigma-70 family RNA polymerase sigma factor [Variovorax sp. Sphag1AA]MBB3181864.1 RNA polymerase sigma-70 factor (ECF subfamily) [Variovorax sp. Sphag1AA]